MGDWKSAERLARIRTLFRTRYTRLSQLVGLRAYPVLEPSRFSLAWAAARWRGSDAAPESAACSSFCCCTSCLLLHLLELLLLFLLDLPLSLIVGIALLQLLLLLDLLLLDPLAFQVLLRCAELLAAAAGAFAPTAD